VDYQRTTEEAEKEIASLLEQRQRIDARISLLKTVVQNCRALLGSQVNILVGNYDIDHPYPDQGITNEIRKVLNHSTVPLSAPEIRAALEKSGVDFSGYANPGAVVHNTLSRLGNQGEVMRVANASGQNDSYAIKRNHLMTLTDPPPPPGAQGPQWGAPPSHKSSSPPASTSGT
jgi:hypothetical protein